MDAEKCVCCGKIIPEGRLICPICEQKEVKIGIILQSNNATEEEVENAYELLHADIEGEFDGKEISE